MRSLLKQTKVGNYWGDETVHGWAALVNFQERQFSRPVSATLKLGLD